VTSLRERIRNIGISAHIDSGKTTLTERVLFYTGKIHGMVEVRDRAGRGPAMSTMPLEIEKGITIRSAVTSCEWQGHTINLIDTPGHIDFTIEVERALRVLDGAVLVLCGVAGVQPQSITVDRQMRRYRVPRLAFVNKCDRPGADPLRVCEQLRTQLAHNAVMVQHPIGLEGAHRGVVDLITREAIYFEGEKGKAVRRAPCPADLSPVVEDQRRRLCEALADVDDELAAALLAGQELTPEQLRPALRRATIARTITPVCLGSALGNKGVQPLLDDVVRYLPAPTDMDHEALDRAREEETVKLRADPAAPLVLLAFKLQDLKHGLLTYGRVYQGTLRKGDVVHGSVSRGKTKVQRIVQLHSDTMTVVEEASAGDLVGLFGLDATTGETFTDGAVDYAMTSMHVPEPVVTLAVAPARREDAAAFSKALGRFAREDPTFRVSRDEVSGRTIVGGMGELHLEIYLERMRREQACDVTVGPPEVAYRETVTQRARFEHTHRKQSGGPGQYAKIGGWVEPLPAVDGEPVRALEFVDATSGGTIPADLMRSVEKGFAAALAKGGLIGSPVVGVRVIVDDGDTHDVDSKDIAFQTCARDAWKKVYPAARPVILEPLMRVEVDGPDGSTGAMLSGLNRRRGIVQGSLSTTPGETRITALVPLKEMFGYSTDLRSQTQGKASFTMELDRYAQVPRQVQEALVAEASTKTE
jgi:elongation factor G